MSASEARRIFEEACDRPTAERAAFIAAACGGRDDLTREVESLVHAFERAGDFLDVPVGDAPLDADDVIGAAIGPYTIEDRLGEGGFGVVYRARQDTPIRREVALKILKRGMDTDRIIARFESERRTLALMDHTNIARVLDAGTTTTGKPYFVMELVQGVAITDYCDAERLGPRERLRLLEQVCHAVQHAHQKGVIHRDLKPVEHPRGDRRRPPGAEGHRLRHRQGDATDRDDRSATHLTDGRAAHRHDRST